MRQLKISRQITGRDSVAIDKYLQEIGKFEVLTPEEEVVLAKKIHEGDKMALQRLVECNLRFVVSVAKQYQNNGLTLGDLINEGNLGLIKAAKCFDETRGFKFISYAVWWIRQTILQSIADNARMVRLPLNKISSMNKVNRQYFKLEQEFQREPTAEEIAHAMDWTEQEVKDSLQVAHRMVSMDAPLAVGNDSNSTLGDMLVTNDNLQPEVERELFADSLRMEIERSFSTLDPRDAEVLRMYYGLGGYVSMSLDEIAERMDLTSERVRQIKAKAIRKLKDSWRSKRLRAYL